MKASDQVFDTQYPYKVVQETDRELLELDIEVRLKSSITNFETKYATKVTMIRFTDDTAELDEESSNNSDEIETSNTGDTQEVNEID